MKHRLAFSLLLLVAMEFIYSYLTHNDQLIIRELLDAKKGVEFLK